MLVSEVFKSIQGEGPSCGQSAVFLRLARCNLSCAWCDTPYTWDWTRFDVTAEARELSVREVADLVLLTADLHCRLLVVTGGEPLLQQAALVEVLTLVREVAPQIRCEIETNGTVEPSAQLVGLVKRFVVSPKLINAGLPEHRRYKPSVLRTFRDQQQSVLKLVLRNESEFDEVERLVSAIGFSPDRVWIMPLGTNTKECLEGMRHLAERTIALGFNLSGRSHIFIWGDRRGT